MESVTCMHASRFQREKQRWARGGLKTRNVPVASLAWVKLACMHDAWSSTERLPGCVAPFARMYLYTHKGERYVCSGSNSRLVLRTSDHVSTLFLSVKTKAEHKERPRPFSWRRWWVSNGALKIRAVELAASTQAPGRIYMGTKVAQVRANITQLGCMCSKQEQIKAEPSLSFPPFNQIEKIKLKYSSPESGCSMWSTVAHIQPGTVPHNNDFL